MRYTQRWYDVFLRGMPEERTRADVEFLLRVLPPAPARVLDVACGLGRHMRRLAEHGYACVGVEVNDAIAAEARGFGLDVRTLDMRELPHVGGDFDAVISMWSSFGWFDDATNAAVLRAMAAKLAPGGVLVLDLPHAEFFEPRQGPFELRAGVVETKTVRDGRLHVDHDDGTHVDWRLYEPDELPALAGLTLGVVERSPGVAAMRVVLHASPARSAASEAPPITSEATVR